MPSIRAILTGFTIFASNMSIISATKFTLANDAYGCGIQLQDACGCTGYAGLPGMNLMKCLQF